ncbi:MAG: 50S ribosomal protein L10 [Acidimicrobiales bacterium]
MAGPRPEKVAVVEEVKDHLERADAAILTEYRGLKVSDLATLRRALRSAGADYKIYKNTLVRRATAEAGASVIDSLLEGPTGIAFVDADVAGVAKVLRDFARTNPALVVKGSFVGGSILDAPSTARLADLPSRDVLLAQIAGAFAAPMRQFAGLLKALPQNLAYGLAAVIDQKRAAGDTSGETTATQPAATEVPPEPESTPEQESQAQVDAPAEPDPEPEHAAEPEAAAPAEPDPEPEHAAEPEAAAAAEPDPGLEAATEPEAAAAAEPDPGLEAATEPEAEPGPAAPTQLEAATAAVTEPGQSKATPESAEDQPGDVADAGDTDQPLTERQQEQ